MLQCFRTRLEGPQHRSRSNSLSTSELKIIQKTQPFSDEHMKLRRITDDRRPIYFNPIFEDAWVHNLIVEMIDDNSTHSMMFVNELKTLITLHSILI
jgi:hypothetical protein